MAELDPNTPSVKCTLSGRFERSGHFGSTKIGGPVTRAIATMRAAEREESDAAIRRMLTGRDDPPRFVQPTPFGPNREALRALSIAGLISAFAGYGAASDAFTHEANTPRAESDAACSNLLDEAAEAHHWAMDAIADELESRTPDGVWETDGRAILLARRCIQHEDLDGAQRFLDELRQRREA